MNDWVHDRMRLVSWALAAVLLLLVLKLRLVPALLSGLLVFELVHLLAARMQRRITTKRGRLLAVTLIATFVVGATTAAIVGAIAFLRSDAGSLASLFGRMAEIIEDARTALPPWLLERIPDNADALRTASVGWLREHAVELRQIGKQTGVVFAQILVGMIIGAMISLQEASSAHAFGPLAQAFIDRMQRLADAFRRIVFAQVQISALNTAFTALYLVVALPLFGVQLPLIKTMIAVTFIAGLLPVVGNLISNTVIVVVSLAHSPYVAVASLAFLVTVHKLEYFLNARIVGGRINARAWELLTAMLLMEAAFGMPGVVAAPIIYAWAKDELSSARLI